MSKSVEYYLSHGFDHAMAEYFSKGRRTVIAVKPLEDYRLIIDFDNGERRIYDMKPLFDKGSVFEKISKKQDFDRVYVDDTNSISWDIDPDIDSNEVWENKIDLCPDTCYVDSLPYFNQ